MNAEQAKKAKELFLSEIDSKDFTDDERLIIANEGWDAAFKFGVQSMQPKAKEGHAIYTLNVEIPDYSKLDDKQLFDKAAGLMIKLATVGKNAEPQEYLELLVKVQEIGKVIAKRHPKGSPKLQELIKSKEQAFKAQGPTPNAPIGGIKVTGDASNTIVGEKRPEVIETKNGAKMEVIDNAKDAVKKAMENKVVEQEPTPDKPKATRKSRAKGKN